MAPSTRKYARSLNENPPVLLVAMARVAKINRIGPKNSQVNRPRTARVAFVCGVAIRNLPSRSGDAARRWRFGERPRAVTRKGEVCYGNRRGDASGGGVTS